MNFLVRIAILQRGNPLKNIKIKQKILLDMANVTRKLEKNFQNSGGIEALTVNLMKGWGEGIYIWGD